MVSPGPSVRRGRGNKKGKRKRLHPPQDIREGMSNAIQIVREVSLNRTKLFFLFVFALFKSSSLINWHDTRLVRRRRRFISYHAGTE